MPGTPRHASFDSGNIEELVQRLQREENVYVQADILNHLYNTWWVGLSMYCCTSALSDLCLCVCVSGRNFELLLGQQKCSLVSLLEELYQKSGTLQVWYLVRHMAGLLEKTLEDLGTVGGWTVLSIISLSSSLSLSSSSSLPLLLSPSPPPLSLSPLGCHRSSSPSEKLLRRPTK